MRRPAYDCFARIGRGFVGGADVRRFAYDRIARIGRGFVGGADVRRPACDCFIWGLRRGAADVEKRRMYYFLKMAPRLAEVTCAR